MLLYVAAAIAHHVKGDGLGFDFSSRYPDKINAVTKLDVQKAAKKYLTLDSYVISIVGPK